MLPGLDPIVTQTNVECCEAYHRGMAVPPTAEKLRSIVAANGNQMMRPSKRDWARVVDGSPATCSRAIALLASTGAVVSVSDVGEVAIRLVA